jgi:hypothetical protein
METEAGRARAWLAARRGLAFELPPLLAVGVVLFVIAPVAERAVLDVRALYLASLALFSLGAIEFVRRVLEVIAFTCPRCHEDFSGRVPFRARCASCGFRPSEAGEAHPEGDARERPRR